MNKKGGDRRNYLADIDQPVSYTRQGHVRFFLPMLLAEMYHSAAEGSL